MSNRDIVSDMVQQMGLTPQMADQMQNQQGGMAGVPYSGGYGPGGPGLPSTPEEQMRLMEAAQQPPMMQQQMPEYDSDSETETTASTESDVDLEKVGLNSPPKGWVDSIMNYLKDPLVVMVLFVIINLSQVGDLLRKVLPAMLVGNSYYFIGAKALIMGTVFMGSRLVIS